MRGIRTELMVKVTIDGTEYEASEDQTILDVARAAGIRIPTLCYMESLPPYGACRLCAVEVVSGGRPGIVASCVYPVADGLVVRTDTPEVLDARRMVLRLLLARSPRAKRLQVLAQEFGVEPNPRFALEEDDCILCGLCERACLEIVGVGAISIGGRGHLSKVEPPLKKPSAVCISCGTCTTVCPTGAVDMRTIDNTDMFHRWKEEEEGRKCRVCGQFHAMAECGEDYKSWFSGEDGE